MMLVALPGSRKNLSSYLLMERFVAFGGLVSHLNLAQRLIGSHSYELACFVAVAWHWGNRGVGKRNKENRCF